MVEYILSPFFTKMGINEIDTFFISHMDSDHVGALEELSKNIKINNIAYGNIKGKDKKYLEESFSAPKQYVLNKEYPLTENTKINILLPNNKNYFSTENDNSMVFMLEYENAKILFTGDVGNEGTYYLINNLSSLLDCDIIKMPHHGSTYELLEDLIDASTPSVALIGVGEDNSYGHPKISTINYLEYKGIHTFRTDLDGCIYLKITKEKTNIYTYVK